jgi:hypothetical protein
MHTGQDFSQSASGEPMDSKAILVSAPDLKEMKLSHFSNFIGETVSK